MANLFYFIIMGAVALSAWIGTGNMIVAVLVLDYAIATFNGLVPAYVTASVGLLNIFMFTITLLWNPFSPHKTN